MAYDFKALASRATRTHAQRGTGQAAPQPTRQAAPARDAKPVTIIAGTLIGPVEHRSDIDGTALLRLKVNETEWLRTTIALWKAESQKESDAFLALPGMEGVQGTDEETVGPQLLLHGHWERVTWKKPDGSWGTSLQFRAIRVEVTG